MAEASVAEQMHSGATDDATPIRLDGLTKRFKGGLTALDSVSLRVERGQVFGLLGPNGSGKTTALRLLVGLMGPSAGHAYLFGRPVAPGAMVLGRVGALIEGPGFIPHLSGRANLDLYWRAGDRRRVAPRLADALELADLGDALDRKVRTYSRGMQQRLAIAQALLSGPELLILDEPTAGLDPQEMYRFRAMIRRVSAAGATVLLSSHLLAEVEQVCTHAAVIDRGRLLSAGTLAQLTGAQDSLYLEVGEPPAASTVIRGLAGVTVLQQEGHGFVLALHGAEVDQIVAALVAEGVKVRTVTRRRSLEDSFLQLLRGEQR